MEHEASSAPLSAAETWAPPVEMRAAGLPAVPIPDIGRDRHLHQWQAERSSDLTDWRLSLEHAIDRQRILCKIMLIMLILTSGVMGALWVVRIVTATLWTTPYDPLTRPVFWVVALITMVLLMSTIWSQLRLYALRRRLRLARTHGA